MKFLHILSTVLGIGTESNSNTNEHGDEAKRNIDGETIEQWNQVDVYQS